MRANPLVTEVLRGLGRHGTRLDNLGLLILQASVLFVLWPKGGVDELLVSQHSPYPLRGVVMALGLGLAYIALRAGIERVLLPGQHGLRDWTLATPLGLGRILRGYVAAQLVHSVHLVMLSAPLLLVAFTISGGEWAALGWCVAAALAQALFYRLCGAFTYLSIGPYEFRNLYAIRTILVMIYVVVGWFLPVTSHFALSFRILEDSPAQSTAQAVPDPATFLAIYLVFSLLAAAMLYRLLARERRQTAGRDDNADLSKAIP